MAVATVIVKCPVCGQKNRCQSGRWPKCGRCKTRLHEEAAKAWAKANSVSSLTDVIMNMFKGSL